MTTAQLFVQAVHTANTLVAAARWWGIFAAAVCVFVIPTVIGGLAWAWDAARGRLYGRQTAETGPQAAEEPRPAKRRPVPSWAHTEPYDYDHAA